MYQPVPTELQSPPPPHNPRPGKDYRVKVGTRIFIRSPRSTKPNARWVAAVVKHWSPKSNCWMVKVVQENLIESWWMVVLEEGRWKLRRKLTHRERERKAASRG